MLSGLEITRQIQLGNIEIYPFDFGNVNPNSVNVRLGDEIMWIDDVVVDLHRKPLSMLRKPIPSEGFLLKKGNVYLASTIERIHSKCFVPVIDGRSTIGRYGLAVHITAGFGDVGFNGQFVLELEARHRDTLIRPGDMIAQVSFHEVTGEISLYNGSYQNQTGPLGPKPLGDKNGRSIFKEKQ